MDERNHIVDGGIVKRAMPFFRPDGQIAVIGVWSGGTWSPESQVWVRQYRSDVSIGTWRIAGVDYPSRPNTDAVLLLEPQGDTSPPDADDIFVFGEGEYHHLPVEESTLPLDSDAAVEIGDARYHGVAQVRDGQVVSVVLFHAGDVVIDQEAPLSIWWRDQEFVVRLAQAQASLLPHDIWLADFDRDPGDALERFLDGRVYMGHLERNSGHEILFRLFHEGGAERVTALDRAIRSWFETYWERAPESVSASQWTEMLRDVFSTITRLNLRESQDWLLSRYERARKWLRGFYLSDARDPEADLLKTLALSQRDQRLLPLWKRLCCLTEDRPLHFASLGLLGLRNLPGPHGELHPAVFSGIVELANALNAQALPRETREAFWEREVRAIMARYRYKEPYWRRRFQPLVDGDSEAARLLGRLLPDSRNAFRRGRSGGRLQQSSARPPALAELRRVLELIQTRVLDDIRDEVEHFLSKHRHYAQQTGDAEYLVKTFSNLSGRLRRSDPAWSLALLREAFVWEPYNPFLWTGRARVESYLGHDDRATALLWEAKRKFPENVVVRNSLAQLLRRQEKLDIAEMMYRQTMKDFPQDVVSRGGLAEMLKAQQRWGEAEALYRETMVAFPQNVVSRNGLAEVLKAQQRWEEAEALYRETMAVFPQDVVSRGGLAVLWLQQQKLQEALDLLHQTVERFPADSVSRGLLSRIQGDDIVLDRIEATYHELTSEINQGEDDAPAAFDTHSEFGEDDFSDVSVLETEEELEVPTDIDDASVNEAQELWELETLSDEIDDSEIIGLANAYRLAARWADGSLQDFYKQKFQEACEQALAKNDQALFALLERGFGLLDDDPKLAEPFFKRQLREGKHAHVLGFHLGALQAQDRNHNPVTEEQWQAVFERFPRQRMLITIEYACQALEHANGNAQSALRALSQQLRTEPDRLPVTLRENHRWLPIMYPEIWTSN